MILIKTADAMHTLIAKHITRIKSIGDPSNNVVKRWNFSFYHSLAIATIALTLSACSDDISQLGEASYSVDENTVRCAADTKPGKARISNNESTADGLKYNVRTPLNYDATISHPLLMVYAPARKDHFESEKFTDLTHQATTAGFVVAYTDHRALSPTELVELSSIPGLVAQNWCINQNRVFFTGHSDGGTASMALAFMAGTKNIPAAIAPSAIGIRGGDLNDRKCPAPIPVMLMHSANDRLFRGFGMETVLWWASCNQCDLNSTETLDNGCLSYKGCANDVKVLYCEGKGSHAEWPGINDSIIDFFTQSASKKTKPRVAK